MKPQKVFLIKLISFMFILLIFLCGFQIVKVEDISGVIENIDKNSKSIVVNGEKVFISSGTNIVDENKNILKIEDLALKSPIAIEGIRDSKGFFARRIHIKSQKSSDKFVTPEKERKPKR